MENCLLQAEGDASHIFRTLAMSFKYGGSPATFANTQETQLAFGWRVYVNIDGVLILFLWRPYLIHPTIMINTGVVSA